MAVTTGQTARAGDGGIDRFRTRLGGLTWAHLLNDGASNYLPGVLPAVLATLDQPAKMAGVLVTALTIGQALQPLTGRLADRIGGRSLIMIGLTASSVGGGLLGVAHSLWSMIALLVLIGVGNAFFHPQALAGIRAMMAGRQGLVTSAFLVGGELGRGLWPTLASLIVAHLGLGGLWILAVPGLVTVPWIRRWAPSLSARRGHGRAIRWRAHARPLAVLIGYQGIRTVTVFSFVTFLPILWDSRGASLVSGASVITTMTVVGVVGNFAGGHLSDRVGRRPVLVASALGAAVLVAPMAYLDGPWAWIVAGALGIALFMTAPVTVLIGQDIFPENRSMGSGIALGFSNGVGALLVFVIGLGIGDDVAGVFWVLCGLSAVGAVAALLFAPDLMR
ncbi:MFS transporter [Tomitella cavernea]|uniref:MFS transporter n=1 Tax=Tomitella cavernea TaxID=1387982 RepID=UPI0019069BAF|nr:MFS transporter [Tomitella cavernea]